MLVPLRLCFAAGPLRHCGRGSRGASLGHCRSGQAAASLGSGWYCRYCEDQLLEVAVRYGLCQPPSALLPLEDMLRSHLQKVRQAQRPMGLLPLSVRLPALCSSCPSLHRSSAAHPGLHSTMHRSRASWPPAPLTAGPWPAPPPPPPPPPSTLRFCSCRWAAGWSWARWPPRCGATCLLCRCLRGSCCGGWTTPRTTCT